MLFVVILAFLVGRVRAGADPGLARSATRAVQSAPPAATGSDPRFGGGTDPQSQSVDPNDPFGQQTDPGANGTTDNFGNAVPDQSGGTQDFSQGGGTQDSHPPSTHVS